MILRTFRLHDLRSILDKNIDVQAVPLQLTSLAMVISKTDAAGAIDLDLPVPTNLASMSKVKRHALYRFYTENGRLFTVEYSPSNRGKCRACKRIIAKGEIRFRHIVCGQKCFQHKAGRADTCGRWHINCFMETQDKHPDWFIYTNPGWKPIRSLDQILGSRALSQHDRETLASQLHNGCADTIKVEPKKFC